MVRFALFLILRLRANRTAARAAVTGIVCWIFGLALESVLQTTLAAGDTVYTAAVIAEETAEMMGAICVLWSILIYVRTRP